MKLTERGQKIVSVVKRKPSVTGLGREIEEFSANRVRPRKTALFSSKYRKVVIARLRHIRGITMFHERNG